MHLGAHAVCTLDKLRRRNRMAIRRGNAQEGISRAPTLEKLEERLLLSGLVLVEQTYAEDPNGDGTFHEAYAASESSATITAADSLDAGNDQTVDEGDTVTINATFTDPNASGPTTAVIDWGDGHITVASVNQSAGTLTGSHVYQDDEAYTATVILDSTDGSQQIDTVLVTVNNTAPTTDPIGDAIIDVGDTYHLMANFDDAGLLDTHTATIDWGDGSGPQPLTVMRNPPPQSQLTATLRTTTSTGVNLDPSGFWTQSRVDLAQAAIDDLLMRFGDSLAAIEPGTGKSYSQRFFDAAAGTQRILPNVPVAENELIFYLGSANLGSAPGSGFVLAQASPGGFSVNTSDPDFFNAVTARGQEGGLIDPPIDFGSWGGSLFVTTNSGITFHDGLTTDGLGPGEIDLFTVLQHEFLHALGGNGTSEAWDRFANGSFAGPASQLLFNGPVPLHTDGAHWQDGLMFDGAPVLGDPSIPFNQRIALNALDIAGLDDVGWETLPAFGPGGKLTGSHTFQSAGSHAITIMLEDDDGGMTTRMFTMTATDPTVVTSMTTNRGDEQRSMVRSLAYAFSAQVTLNASALVLTNLTTNTTVAPGDVRMDYNPGTRTATWTFPGLPGESLAGGNYEAILLGEAVTNGRGAPLDGDADGTPGGDHVASLFRFFGDSDGDRDVDFADLFNFRAALQSRTGDPDFNADFDVDADGDVDFVGLFAFRRNLQQQLPDPGVEGLKLQSSGAGSGDGTTDRFNAVSEPGHDPLTEERRLSLLAVGAALLASSSEDDVWSGVDSLRQFQASRLEAR